MRMNRIVVILSVLLLACGIPGRAGNDVGRAGNDVIPMTVERLPDLNVPRSGHVLAYVDGELTVIGGHTTGFVPTATAEFYRDGRWQLVETLFPHDFGFGVVLPSQEVLVGGGCAEAFGIGQTFGVELYNPRTHGFAPLPILDRRRTRASAARLSDGTLAVAGNWYAEDAIATYSPESGGRLLRESSQERVTPFILQSASNNALILSSAGARGDTLAAVVDRLRDGSFEVPLLQEWEHLMRPNGQQMSQFFIGDETVGGYAWLLPAIRKTDGQPGLIKVVGEEFSVLETERPLLAEGLEGEALDPYPLLLADKEQEFAWLIQWVDGSSRIFVTRVGYGEALRGGRAPVTFYRAELPDGCLAPMEVPVALLPGGRIALVGGRTGYDEYHPVATALILHTEPMPREAGIPWKLLGLICGLLTGALAVFVGWRIRRRFVSHSGLDPESPGDKAGMADQVGHDGSQQVGDDGRMAGHDELRQPGGAADLLSRIVALMEKEELFRQKGLKVSDLATRLGTNATYISACLNGQAGKNFPEFVNDYRLRCAQQLMTTNPDMLLAEVAEESGFSNEQSFFRTFKARTGLTPQEWKATI